MTTPLPDQLIQGNRIDGISVFANESAHPLVPPCSMALKLYAV
jgi:hypothetical protein